MIRPPVLAATVLAATVLMPLAAPAQEFGLPIRIEFDDNTSETLLTMGEWVSVSAFYFGDPALDDVPLDELGQVFLGSEEVRIYPVSQTVTLGGGLAGAPMDWVTEARVNVNVFTARFMDDNNLLDCGIVEDAVDAVRSTENVISCTLLPPM